MSALDDLNALVARSRSIGAHPEWVIHGGGNTSTKTMEPDLFGRERPVLRIKGSGTDLATIGPDGFPGLWLDDLLPLRARDSMSDDEMTAFLARCAVEPDGRRPSIETLLHAFLPARCVDHVHADAICALTNTPDGERHVAEALGDDVAVVGYIRPGFALSKLVGELADARAVVLAHHGLVTWGEDGEESVELTRELVERAQAHLARHRVPRSPGPGPASRLDDAAARTLLAGLRGALWRAGGRVILHVDRGQRTLADRDDVGAVAAAARATPDHMLRIGRRSAVLVPGEDPAAVIAAFARDHDSYVARHRSLLPDGLMPLDGRPRVVLVPGLGAVAAAGDPRAARVAADLAAHSHAVTAEALDAFGAVAWLDEEQTFLFDHWPMELAKLQSAPAPRALAARVVHVEAHEAVAIALRQAGAVVVGPGADPFLAHGGLDAVVASAEAMPVLLRTYASGLRAQGLPVAAVVVGADAPPDVVLDGVVVRTGAVAGEPATAGPAVVALLALDADRSVLRPAETN